MKLAAPRVDIAYRAAESPGPGGWATVAAAIAEEDLRDELASWRGPLPRHGDIVRVTSTTGRPWAPALFVFDGDRGAFRSVPDVARGRSGWVERWEGADAQPSVALNHTAGVALPRVMLAACAVVRATLHLADDRTRRVFSRSLDVAGAVARGQATRGAALGVLNGTLRAMEAQTRRAALSAARVDEVVLDAAAIGACTITEAAASDSLHIRRSLSAVAASHAWRALRSSGADLPDVMVVVRSYVPLAAGVCASMGLRDPLPPLGPPGVVR